MEIQMMDAGLSWKAWVLVTNGMLGSCMQQILITAVLY